MLASIFPKISHCKSNIEIAVMFWSQVKIHALVHTVILNKWLAMWGPASCPGIKVWSPQRFKDKYIIHTHTLYPDRGVWPFTV